MATLKNVNTNTSTITYSNSSNALMVCVECGHPIAYIYKEYSKGNIRLSRCRKCRLTADKYVEFEGVLLLIDMVLHRLAAYRHVLINRPAHAQHRPRGAPSMPSMWKVGVALVLIDTYSKLYRVVLENRDSESLVTKPTFSSLLNDTNASSSSTASSSSSSATSDMASLPRCSDLRGAGDSHLSADQQHHQQVSELGKERGEAAEGDEDEEEEDGEEEAAVIEEARIIEELPTVIIDDTCLGPGLLSYEIDLLRQHSSYAALIEEREARMERLYTAAATADFSSVPGIKRIPIRSATSARALNTQKPASSGSSSNGATGLFFESWTNIGSDDGNDTNSANGSEERKQTDTDTSDTSNGSSNTIGTGGRVDATYQYLQAAARQWVSGSVISSSGSGSSNTDDSEASVTIDGVSGEQYDQRFVSSSSSSSFLTGGGSVDDKNQTTNTTTIQYVDIESEVNNTRCVRRVRQDKALFLISAMKKKNQKKPAPIPRRVVCGICGDSGPDVIPAFGNDDHDLYFDTFDSRVGNGNSGANNNNNDNNSGGGGNGGGGGGTTLSSITNPYSNYFDVTGAMLDLPDLLTWTAPIMVAASIAEWIGYLVGALITLRLIGSYTRSRARIDPASGGPRVPPPRSRRSLAAMEILATMDTDMITTTTSAAATMPATSISTGPSSTSHSYSAVSGNNNTVAAQNNCNTHQRPTLLGPPSTSLHEDGRASSERSDKSDETSSNANGLGASSSSTVSSSSGDSPSTGSDEGFNDRTSSTSGGGGGGEGGSKNPCLGADEHLLSSSSSPDSSPPVSNRSSASIPVGTGQVKLVPFSVSAADAAGSSAASSSSAHGSGSKSSTTASSSSVSTAAGNNNANSIIASRRRTTQQQQTAAYTRFQIPSKWTWKYWFCRINAFLAPPNSNQNLSSFSASSSSSSSSSSALYFPPYSAPHSSSSPSSSTTSTALMMQIYSIRDAIDPSPPTWREMKTTAYALLISSFPKAFVLLTAIWAYPPGFQKATATFALTSNMAALQAFVDCTPLEATAIVGGGYLMLLVVRMMLVLVGVSDKFALA